MDHHAQHAAAAGKGVNGCKADRERRDCVVGQHTPQLASDPPIQDVTVLISHETHTLASNPRAILLGAGSRIRALHVQCCAGVALVGCKDVTSRALSTLVESISSRESFTVRMLPIKY